VTTDPIPAAAEDDHLEPYRDAIRRHGAGFRATLWGSEAAQRVRFDVMIDLVGFDGCTVVDAGCGHGDFARQLVDRGVAFHRYVGVDALAPVIDRARERVEEWPGRDVRFEVLDLAARPAALADFEPDWVCLCGTLNTMDDETARRIVRASFESAAQGVVFNFLSDRPHARWAGRDLTPARRFDTVAWLDWAMSLSSRVSFTQSYLDGHDATVVVAHDGDVGE
jgi:SAM-dependent methyltransferase